MDTYSLHNKGGDAHYRFGTTVRRHINDLDSEELADFKYLIDARKFIKMKEEDKASDNQN
jgi:hypothetical protein